MKRWHYCAVRDEPELSCAWPNCTCGKGEASALEAEPDRTVDHITPAKPEPEDGT